MKFKPTRISVKHPKRLVILIISIVVFLGLATYATFSFLHWREFEQNSQKAATSLKSAIETSLGSDASAPVPSVQIDTVVENFEKDFGTNPCELSVWYNWQTILPSLNDRQSACEQRFATALNVITTLKPLSQFLKDEVIVSDLLSATAKATEDPTDYKAAGKVWEEAVDSPYLSTQNEFDVVHTKATEIMEAISTAYAALDSAASNENKAAFDKATTDLQTAYSGFDKLKTTVNDERTKLILVFITAYEGL